MDKVIRNAVRWILLASILVIIVMAVLPYLAQSGIPPVQMPGGNQADNGVSSVLDGDFDLLRSVDPGARLHFVVQFGRELTPAETEKFAAQNGLALVGPIPENAYYTSTSANEWLGVRAVLTTMQPESTKIFEIRISDRLSPQIRDPNDPAVVLVPPYALLNQYGAEVYVRFHGDVPVPVQRQILNYVDATQPDGTPVDLGPSGIWAVVLPEANVPILSEYDEVRFIEPRIPPVELDIDQARMEVGAGNLATSPPN
jgi:hypothetical protein